MKTLLCLAVLLAGVFAEFCGHDDDCRLTQCGDGWHTDCYKHNGQHLCTCVPGHGDGGDGGHTSCTNQQQCKDNHGKCSNDHQDWHCVDLNCRCF